MIATVHNIEIHDTRTCDAYGVVLINCGMLVPVNCGVYGRMLYRLFRFFEFMYLYDQRCMCVVDPGLVKKMTPRCRISMAEVVGYLFE